MYSYSWLLFVILPLLSLSLFFSLLGGKWLSEYSMACYILHFYIIFSPTILVFLFSSFPFPPLFPPPSVLFLGEMGCVSMCIPLTSWKLSTKSLVVRFRKATASHFQALDILYVLCEKYFKCGKKPSCGVSLKGANTHNTRHFLTQRPITRSILRVSKSMASH